MWGGGGKEWDRESLKVWQFDSVVRTTCYISAIIGLWKELSKMKVFKKQLIMCIKRLRQFCGIKKNPEKTRVVRTTHGRWRTLKFLCPPTTMRCTYNKPFSSKLLTLQGNGKHKQCFICHALSYSRLRAKSETKNMSGRERVKTYYHSKISKIMPFKNISVSNWSVFSYNMYINRGETGKVIFESVKNLN